MSTPNLAIAHIQASQNSKEVTANEAYDRIDSASYGYKPITMTDADYTLTTYGGVGFPNETENLYYVFTGTLTAGRNIIVPTTKKMYLVKNSTTSGFAITVKTLAGTGFAVINGTIGLLYCDGTNVVVIDVNSFVGLSDVPVSYSGDGGFAVQVNAGATGVEFVAKPLDVGFFLPGKPTASQVVIRIIPVRAASFPASMTGSTSKAGAASTGTVLYTFLKNGVSFATLTFTAADSGTWTSAAGATFNGTTDILTVTAPSSVDATLSDVGIVMKGTRT